MHYIMFPINSERSASDIYELVLARLKPRNIEFRMTLGFQYAYVVVNSEYDITLTLLALSDLNCSAMTNTFKNSATRTEDMNAR